MAKINEFNQIKEVLENIDSIQAMGQGFIALSQGKAVIPLQTAEGMNQSKY